MAYRSLQVLLAYLIFAMSPSLAQTCYYTENDVGCNPEGWPYDFNNCPATCTGNEQVGCHETTTFAIKWPQWDTMDRDVPLFTPNQLDPGEIGFIADDNAEGTYLYCLTEGDCQCWQEIDEFGDESFFCQRVGNNEWTEWFAEPTAETCDGTEMEDET